MAKQITAALVVILWSLSAQASDFVILGVGLGTLVIAALSVSVGVAATRASRNKGRAQAAPYLIVIVVLVFIGVGLVMDEAQHMADLDFVGMLLTVLVPGVLSFAIPLFVRAPKSSPKE